MRISREYAIDQTRLRGVRCSGGALDDLREGINTFMDTERVARRVLGGAHPFVAEIEGALRKVRALIRARETPPGMG